MRERKHRASQEGLQTAPQVIDDNVILRQRLSVSKWKGAVKAVGAVNKMGMLVRSRPPSAPAASALVNQSRQGTTGEQLVTMKMHACASSCSLLRCSPSLAASALGPSRSIVIIHAVD